MAKHLPVLSNQRKAHTRSTANASTHAQVWVRISAFLAQRSSNTQRTYLAIVHEWSHFLGAQAGSEEAAELVLSATDIDAVRYRMFLEKQPGQKPRLSSSQRQATGRAVSTERRRAKARDGAQSTLANATIAKKFAALRRIYRMLIAADLGMSQNPFDTDKVPPPSAKSGQKRPTEMMDFSKVKEILSLPDPKTPKGLRDFAILALLFGGGLRRSEVVKLRLGDVKRSPKGTAYVRLRSTKAKVDADQAIPAWAAKPLIDLVALRTKDGAGSGDYVFISFRGQAGKTATEEPFSDSGLYKLFKQYCARAGAGEFLSPHSARATAITKLLADGVPHREVQEFSRHASVQMVELYDKRRLGVDENPGRSLDYD